MPSFLAPLREQVNELKKSGKSCKQVINTIIAEGLVFVHIVLLESLESVIGVSKEFLGRN